MSNAPDEPTEAERESCTALLWIHSHGETGKPLQIEVAEWNGRVDVLDQLRDEAKIGDLNLDGLKFEDWIHVRVEYRWKEREYEIALRAHVPAEVVKATAEDSELLNWLGLSTSGINWQLQHSGLITREKIRVARAQQKDT